jgi:hypothetical protein
MTERSPQKLQQRQLILDRGRPESGSPYGLPPGRAQKWILHFNLEHVHGPEKVDYEPDELVVVCLVRDGRPYVKSFVEHYLSLGAKHLFFLDNGSTDGTVEALKGYDNVTVLRSTLPFRRYKQPMKQYLIEHFGWGRWSLCVDIDELFDYPYSDVVRLGSLLRYLNEKSYTAVVAQMLDMFPAEPLSDAASEEDEPLKERHRFYDISNIHAQYYSNIDVHSARDHWAYRRACGTSNVLANEEIEVYRNGIQSTVFGGAPPLTKHPLVFVNEKIKPLNSSPHSVSDARIADFTCVLFHYKFLNHLYELIRRAAREDRYGNTRHKRWLGVLEENPNLLVKGESARELRSVNELVENLFLVVSEEYMLLVYDEEQRKKGAGHAALRGEPGGGGPEDEAAFYRAKAEAKVQNLRALRLQRPLEQLREQNQREIEQLRGQHQRRIERLTRRLARTKRRARNKNRALANQLRSVRASRSWRLLNKLGRIRTRLLGK